MEKFFRDRLDAGKQLSKELAEYAGTDTIVLAIPRGGIPVGYEVATSLRVQMDLIIPRKLPIPWNPEAGFGAVTAEGTIVLNQAMVEPLGLTDDQIKSIAEEVRLEIERRETEFRGGKSPADINGKTVIIVDDGVASGYTMLAAVKSVRRRQPKQIITAAPVASASAAALIRPEVDRLVVLIESHRLPFAVADFYLNWYDLEDSEVKEYLDRANGRSNQIQVP